MGTPCKTWGTLRKIRIKIRTLKYPLTFDLDIRLHNQWSFGPVFLIQFESFHLPFSTLLFLSKGDDKEIERLFTSCHDKLPFYLKNHNVGTKAALIFGKDLYGIPLEEKAKDAIGDGINYLRYKHIGESIVDKRGTPDSQETWNVL